MDIYKAIVKDTNPVGNNFTVQTENLSTKDAYPLLNSGGEDGMSLSSVSYTVGQEVLCIDLNKECYIVGVVPKLFNRVDPKGGSSFSGIDLNSKTSVESSFILDSKFGNTGSHSSRGIQLPENLPGDQIIKVPGGNSLKLLSGGVNVLDSGTAKVTTNGVTDEVAIDCHTFKLNTGFGQISVAPDSSGAFSMQVRGNPNPTDINPNREPSGEELLDVNIKIGSGIEVIGASGYGIKISPSGRITLLGESVELEKATDGTITEIAGSTEDVNNHNVSAFDISFKSLSNLSEEVATNKSQNIAGDLISSVGRYKVSVVAGPSVIQEPLLATPLKNSVFSRQDITLSGGHKVEIGSVLDAGYTYRVDNTGGDIQLKTNSVLGSSGSVLLETPSELNATHGAWGIINSTKKMLSTSLLSSTPTTPIDGLPNPWALTPPLGSGLDPVTTGLCKYTQLNAILLPVFTALSTALAALSADTTALMTPATKTLLGTAGTTMLAKIALLNSIESSTSWVQETPI